MEAIVTSYDRFIRKEEEGLYLRIPLRVQAGMETLRVSYSYTRHRVRQAPGGRTLREEVSIIDLALEDPGHNLVGASGSERMEVLIHENHATPGYRPVPLTEGTWYLVLGAYRVEEGGCPVTVTLTQTPREGLLLRGETHCHTRHSDGWYTVEELLARARQDRLDYLCVTDHNSMASNACLPSTPDLTVIPGVELTYYRGHCNLYGLARPVKTYVANTREEVLDILREGRQAGALISINHPALPGVSWDFGLGGDVPADAVEIWNGPFTPANGDSLRLWHRALSEGRIWPAIGGSDYHRAELFRSLATPCTFLYSRGRGASAILEAIRMGHAFVGMSPDAPLLYLRLGSALMGDVHRGPEKRIELRAEGLGGRDELRLVNQNGVFFKEAPGACHRFEAEADAGDSLFVRMEVWRRLPGLGETLASVSNPVYLRPAREEAS